MNTPTVKEGITKICLARLAAMLLIGIGVVRAETNVTPTEIKPSPRYAIGAEVGTAGYGPELMVTANKYFTGTFGYTWFSYAYDFNNSHGDFNAKLKLSNVQALVNWHPFAGSFHLSAGAFVSDNKVTLTGRPEANSTFNINDVRYTAAQVGNLYGTGKLLKGTAPYVGLGWSKNPEKGGFGCFFDLGVLFMGSPTVSLMATGPISSDATFQTNLRAEERKTNDDLKPYKYYPVLQFGLFYRF